MRRARGVAALAVAMLTAGLAHAQPADHARAEQHFRAGRNLVLAGRCSDAIEELRKSIEFEPNIGAYLNLGDCHFKMRNLEAAWRAYKEAEAQARSRNDPRLDDVRAALANIERTSVRLDVVVPKAAPADLVLRVDGRPTSKEGIEPVVVEPDTDHVVTAHAEGKPPWRKVVRGQAGMVLRVEVELQDSEIAATAPALAGGAPFAEKVASAPPGARADAGHATRTWGFVIGGAGLAALAAGGVFGVLALNSRNSLSDAVKERCGGSYPEATCNESFRGELDPMESRANTQATVSTVLFGIGGAALVTGVVLWAVAPKSAKPMTTGQRQRWLVGPSPVLQAPFGLSVSGPI